MLGTLHVNVNRVFVVKDYLHSSMSLENLLSILPEGVVLKNASGERMMRFSMLLCMRAEPRSSVIDKLIPCNMDTIFLLSVEIED